MGKVIFERWEPSIADLERLHLIHQQASDPNDPEHRAMNEYLYARIHAKKLMRDLRAEDGYNEWGGKD